MAHAHFRFYEELNDFLRPAARGITFCHSFDGRVSIKDMIESLGVPHTEVELILVNGNSVDFSYLVADGDRISVYPTFESFDISPLLRVRPAPLRRIRFIADSHLGALARYLRMMGFDTAYDNMADDATLAEQSAAEGRILLTRDKGLLKRRIVTHGYFIRNTRPRGQLREVMDRLDLYALAVPFTRCLRCNGRVAPVSKSAVRARLQPATQRYFNDFHQCRRCHQIYWRGSHFERMRRTVDAILQRDVTLSGTR